MAQHKSFSRNQRVADQIQREIADLVRTDLRDPRISLLTITDCEVSRDLAYAKIFYSVLRPEEKAVAQEVLDAAAGFLRNELGHRMRLRVLPKLTFHFDPSIEQGMQMDALISAVRKADDRAHQDEDGADDNSGDTSSDTNR